MDTFKVHLLSQSNHRRTKRQTRKTPHMIGVVEFDSPTLHIPTKLHHPCDNVVTTL